MHKADNIRAALSFIPAHDRDIWLRIGMAIKSELGEQGLDLWLVWSHQAESYDEKAAHDVWRSIKPNGKVTIAKLFYEAKQRGYKPNGEYRPGEATPEDKAQCKRQTGQADEAIQEQQRTEAASKAMAVWKAAQPVTVNHPYLVRKHIKPVCTLREIPISKAKAILGYTPKHKDEPLTGRLIVIPVKISGWLSTLELIDEEGKKTALFRSAKGGGYWAAKALPEGDGQGETLLIGEGVATVLSAKEATRHVAMAALSCGNLQSVAKAMKERYPAATIVILGDLGKGQAKAEQAARTIKGLLAVPDFGEHRPDDAKDFNGLAQCANGLEAVKACIANAEPPPRDQNELRFEWLADVLDESEEEPEWLAHELLLQAGLSMVAARPKAGKSTLVRALALATGQGERFLGRRTRQGTVLYLALEEKRSEVPRHFKKMGATSEPIGIYASTAPADGVEQLRTIVMDERPALTIVDPTIRLARILDSNDYAKVSAALEPFLALARESGSHICLVHHAGRANGRGVDAPMGSTAFAGVPDTILVMKCKGTMRTLSSTQRYGPDLEEVMLEMDEAGWINAAGTKQEYEEREAREAIVAFLKANPGKTQYELRKKIKLRWKTVWAALTALIKDGTVTRQGKGGKQDPYRYFLTPKEAEKESPSQAENAAETESEEPKTSSATEAENQAEKSAEKDSCSHVPIYTREQGNNNKKSDPSGCNYETYSCSRDSAFGH